MRAALLVILLCASVTFGGTAAPANLSLLVMLKILTYDANFAARGDGDFVVLVAHGPEQQQQLSEATGAIAALKQSKLQARPLRFVPVPMAELAAAVKLHSASALLLIKDTTGEPLRESLKIANAQKLYVLALDPQAVEEGAVLGVENRDGKPQVVINVQAAKTAGVAFPVSVLKIARAVQ